MIVCSIVMCREESEARSQRFGMVHVSFSKKEATLRERADQAEMTAEHLRQVWYRCSLVLYWFRSIKMFSHIRLFCVPIYVVFSNPFCAVNAKFIKFMILQQELASLLCSE